MAKVLVGKVSEIPPGKMKGVDVEVGGGRVLVANVGGKFYAMNAVCHHEQCNLDDGDLSGHQITCACHGSIWDVQTGKLVWFTQPLDPEPTFKVLVEGDSVFVEA